jgi:hypothetical protein
MPRSYLARSLKESHEWRRGFVRIFLERDLPQLGININASTMRRFWTTLAHYHGQIWNASEFARSFGVADTTVLGFEVKRTSAPRVTRSMHIAREDLNLRRLDVIHAGEKSFPLATKVRAISMARLLTDLEPLP